MFEAVLSLPWVSLPSYCFLGSVKEVSEEHACLVRVSSIIRSGARLRHLVEVSGKNSPKVSRVLAVPKQPASVHSVSSVSYLTTMETPVCPLYETLSTSQCFLVKETVRKKYLEWVVIAESLNGVNALSRKLKRSGIGAKVVKAERINGGRTLTIRQEEILRQAYMAGFFESPHGTDVRHLAKALDCSPSTLVRLLRKAEKKAIADKLGVA
ncbi:MAG: helix-turn-helix domain-containing protein [Nitrososphaerota archaeon]|nr:helix-turn-helix domain-containing protein [Nitrososphaerota archaeon]